MRTTAVSLAEFVSRLVFWAFCAIWLVPGAASAATAYTFSGSVGGSTYPSCSGSWSKSGTTYTCSGAVTLAYGDSIVPTRSSTVVASAGMTLYGANTIGSSSVAVNLQADWGDIVANVVGTTYTIYGSVTTASGDIVLRNATVADDLTSTSGSITLTSSTLTGNITSSSGNVTLTSTTVNGSINTNGWVYISGGSVTGSVTGSNGVTTYNTVIGGSVTANNGAISLTGGSVAGLVHSDCCSVTTNSTDISGGVSSTNNTVSIYGGTIAGAISSGGGSGIVISGATVTSGSISATNVAIWISNSTIGSSSSSVNITGNNFVSLWLGTVVYGNVTAGSWSGALVIDWLSYVYGVCTSDSNSVAKPSQYPRCASRGTSVTKFNACHNYSGSSCSTSGGRLYTRLAGTAFSTDIVALKSDGTIDTTFSGKATISIIAKTSAGATLDSQNCFTADAAQTLDSAQTAFVSGHLTLSATVTTAYPDARFKIVCDSSNCASSGVTSCSADDFAIRPASFSSVASSASADASGSSTSATPVVKAGAGFTLTATAGAGYNGTPKINASQLSAHSGAVTSGTLSASFGAATASTGVATASAATYTEVGYFRLGIDGVYDNSFTSVDQANGDCTADYSNTAVSSKFGCYFGNTAATSYFGRFIPDHLAVTAGSVTPGCGTFTYFGQDGVTTPFTLTAQNSSAATTSNYTGSFARLTLSSWSSYAFASSTTLPSGATLAASATAPSGSWSNGVASVSAKHQISRPSALAAETALTVTTLPVDSDGVTLSAASAVQSASTPLRFGRLRLSNAFGSDRRNLSMPIEAQYWSGLTWVRNAADSCTSLDPSAVKLSGAQGATQVSSVSLSAGSGSIVLGCPYASCPLTSKPATSLAGSVGVCVDLGSDPASGVACSATSAGKAYLQGLWAPGTTYANDPSATATFGIYAPETKKTVHVRESF